MDCKEPPSSAKYGVEQSRAGRYEINALNLLRNESVHPGFAFMRLQVENEDMPKFSRKVRLRNHLCLPHPRCFLGTKDSAECSTA